MDDPDTAPDPAARHAVIEADHLCECGYNLHGQTITRDERLGLSVVRCPECGRWDAAGKDSTAAQVWLRRIGSVALLLYVLIIVGLCTGVAAMGVGLASIWTEVHTVGIYAHPDDGRPIDNRYEFPDDLPGMVNLAEQAATPGDDYVYLDDLTIAPLNGSRPYGFSARIGYASLPSPHRASEYRPPLSWTAWYVGSLGCVGIVAGTFNAALLWHVRGWRRFTPAGLTVGLSALVWLLVVLGADTYFSFAHREVGRAIAVVQGSILGGWLVGLAIGRPVARAVLSLLLPPKTRQTLAHLWLADGKPLPMTALLAAGLLVAVGCT